MIATDLFILKQYVNKQGLAAAGCLSRTVTPLYLDEQSARIAPSYHEVTNIYSEVQNSTIRWPNFSPPLAYTTYNLGKG